MWLKLKICFGYAILVLLLAFIVYQFRKEQVLRHILRKEEKELAAIHGKAGCLPETCAPLPLATC